MAHKTFVANMPDQAGTFLRAAKIIAANNGNIVRVSYNKAVDPRMLFIDVQASYDELRRIEKSLSDIGYINANIAEIRVIEVLVKIPDQPGSILPILEIFNRYDINISYMNSSASGKPWQDFKFGLLIERPDIIKTLLDEISSVYPVDITECDNSEENLDNTVFYIRLANEIKHLLGLSDEKAMQFISESNRILQVLQSEGENAAKIFGYIKRFAHFVSQYRGSNYKTSTQKMKLSDAVELYSIQPFCGSNTYALAAPDEIVLIDNGFSIYADEHFAVLKETIPNWETVKKRIYITHADVDHCGLLYRFANEGTEIIMNQKSAENFYLQAEGIPDYREQIPLHLGFNKLSQIVSGYVVPDVSKLTVFDQDTPHEHDDFVPIGRLSIGDLDFEILEGSGGHVYGEMIYVCREAGIVFTGDILVNIQGFSKERAEFNSLAPYLMKTVNVNSKKASEMRKQVMALIEDINGKNKKPCIVCGGHGPISELIDGKMVSLPD